MQTPAGSECPFYYEDFHRGRELQECRLIERTPEGGTWEPDHCSNCPVPAITRANACPHMVLEARAKSSLLGFGKRVEVSAMCTRTLEEVEEPKVGCGQCHKDLPPIELPPELQ